MTTKENFFPVGIKRLENHTRGMTAFTITTQPHTTFTILSIHSKRNANYEGERG